MYMERKTNLYHCTNIRALVSILNSKHFRYSYCLEKYDGLTNGFGDDEIAYAMICFADLYSNELYSHMKQFGSDSYILMDKVWAMKNRVCPVIYYHKNSASNIAYLHIAKCAVKLFSKKQDGIEEILFKSVELFRPFFKKYEGKYFIKGTDQVSSESVEFFLEREWRSFPMVKNYEHHCLSKQEFFNETLKFQATKELVDHGYVLEFAWDDILKLGCKEQKKDEVIKAIVNSFGINKEDAQMKIEIISDSDNVKVDENEQVLATKSN